jgi:hypothetical protein
VRLTVPWSIIAINGATAIAETIEDTTSIVYSRVLLEEGSLGGAMR